MKKKRIIFSTPWIISLNEEKAAVCRVREKTAVYADEMIIIIERKKKKKMMTIK